MRLEGKVAAITGAADTFGQLDVMYNNAGIVGAVGPIATTPAEEWQMTLDIHLNGSFFGIRTNCIAPAGMATAMVAGL